MVTVAGRLLAAAMLLTLPWAGTVRAQDSLPLDIDLAADPPTDPTILIPVLYFGVDRLHTPAEFRQLQQAQRPVLTGENPADAEDFPANLVGLDIDAVIIRLEERDWVVITETPRLVQLDRGQLGLDITVDAGTKEIIAAEVVDLT